MEEAPRTLEQDEAKPSNERQTFAREGLTPTQNDTSGSVDEMNRAAEDALLRNVRPDEQID
jgi:hypothetical protein